MRLATTGFSFCFGHAMLGASRDGGEHERGARICPPRIPGRDRLARGAFGRPEPHRARLHDAPDPRPEDHYTVKPGREDFEKGHIPGAQFVDLQADLSANHPKLRFMLPGPEEFAAAIGRFGVGDNSRVILYSTTTPQWATRIWWMLRNYGFDNAAVLNGGFQKWA